MALSGPLKKYFEELVSLLSMNRPVKDMYKIVVNAPFHDKLQATSLDLGIIVFLKVTGKTIDRVAVSKTEHADWATKMLPIPLKKIKVPVGHKQNLVAKAIATGRSQKTTDWKQLFEPAIPDDAARFVQAGAGIDCSLVYPVKNCGQGAALIYSFYQPLNDLGKEHYDFMKFYTEAVSSSLSKSS